MGLDMYLYKSKTPKDMGGKNPRTFKEINEYECYDNYKYINDNKIPLTNKEKASLYTEIMNGNLFVSDGFFHYTTAIKKIGYWRKANMIHNWFVDNCGDGIDECQMMIVPEEKLQELLNICKTVKDSCKLIYEKNTDDDGDEYDNKIIEDSSVAEDLLPTCSGFFFGSTNYDEWYLGDIKNTINILENALLDTDFSKETVYYQASW